MASRSKRSARQLPAMADAASSGISPTLASAAARAASTSSIAWSQARSEKAARIASVEKAGPKRLPVDAGSGGKKGCLSVALHVDVEDQYAALVARHEGGPDRPIADGREHGVGGVGGFLVREVDVRDLVLEKAPREHEDLDV